jgi:hypothetical protein
MTSIKTLFKTIKEAKDLESEEALVSDDLRAQLAQMLGIGGAENGSGPPSDVMTARRRLGAAAELAHKAPDPKDLPGDEFTPEQLVAGGLLAAAATLARAIPISMYEMPSRKLVRVARHGEFDGDGAPPALSPTAAMLLWIEHTAWQGTATTTAIKGLRDLLRGTFAGHTGDGSDDDAAALQRQIKLIEAIDAPMPDTVAVLVEIVRERPYGTRLLDTLGRRQEAWIAAPQPADETIQAITNEQRRALALADQLTTLFTFWRRRANRVVPAARAAQEWVTLRQQPDERVEELMARMDDVWQRAGYAGKPSGAELLARLRPEIRAHLEANIDSLLDLCERAGDEQAKALRHKAAKHDIVIGLGHLRTEEEAPRALVAHMATKAEARTRIETAPQVDAVTTGTEEKKKRTRPPAEADVDAECWGCKAKGHRLFACKTTTKEARERILLERKMLRIKKQQELLAKKAAELSKND